LVSPMRSYLTRRVVAFANIHPVARVVHFLNLHLVGKRILQASAIDDANVFGKVGTTGAEVESALKGKKVRERKIVRLGVRLLTFTHRSYQPGARANIFGKPMMILKSSHERGDAKSCSLG
jgi:hypothetical protein